MKGQVIMQVYFIEGSSVYDSICFFKEEDALEYIKGFATKKGLCWVDKYNEQTIWNYRYITVY
jgi:hypothetical protein